MILLLFLLIGIFAITMIVTYAYDEVEILHELKTVDSSILKHNLYQFLTLMPTILIVLQILINITLILLDNIDEVFFYIRDNMTGIWMLKGVFGLSLLLMTGMLAYKLQESESGENSSNTGATDAEIDEDGETNMT